MGLLHFKLSVYVSIIHPNLFIVNFILNLESAGPSTDTRCLRKVSSSILIYFLYLYNDCRFRYGTGAFVCLLHLCVSDFPRTTFMLSHIERHSVAVFAYAGNDQDLKECLSIWCQELESNQPHPMLQNGALPTELSWHITLGCRTGVEPASTGFTIRCSTIKLPTPLYYLAPCRGLEPLASGVTGRRSNQLS